MKAKILIVDDDADIVTVLEDRLQASGYTTVIARDGQQALDQIEHEAPNLILLDLDLPKLTGIEVLKRLSQIKHVEDLPVIVMTAHGSVNAAVEAMKEGAYDFLTKPLDKDHLLIVIRKALERDSLKRQVAYLRSEVDGRYASIVGASETVRAVIEAAQRAARSDAGVLLLGESGTGKELFARSIHQWSHRHAMPLIVINCVALTETLLENELFGHERGAFTGADRLQKGKLEMADGGTVFLDEIGDMSLPLQAKLLRVLQDREFQRVGGTRTVSVNIRIIAATNKDLRQAVKAGQFREDLYFRLNVITLTLPPLRERPDDIPALANFFLERHARDAKRPGMSLNRAAMETLTPGLVTFANWTMSSPGRWCSVRPMRLNRTCWHSFRTMPASAGKTGQVSPISICPITSRWMRTAATSLRERLKKPTGIRRAQPNICTCSAPIWPV
jgi:DNA-binding NtrC family response regulator